MASSLGIPYATYASLQEKAELFLSQHNPQGTLPIDIDAIVDLKLGIKITPIFHLKCDCDIDAFITSDLTEIMVDEAMYYKNTPRYRFSLAHEIGHSILHRDIYEAVQFSCITDYRRFLRSVSAEDHDRMETQAYHFGGLLLVPAAPLRSYLNQCIELANSHGIRVKGNWQTAEPFVAQDLAERFGVSKDVVSKRICRDVVCCSAVGIRAK
ncbi:MAG: ImmA/IrrE family metallo-endopeptidase [Anaerolineae bacterium]